MTNQLDQLAAEAALRQPVEGEGAFAPPPPPEPMPLPPQVQQLVAVAVRMGGAVATRRAAVTPLEEGEVGALAQAACEVARHYITNTMDARVAAWLGLGMTALAVVANRRPLAVPSAAEPTPPMGTAPPPIDGAAVVAAQSEAVDRLMGGNALAA